MWTDSPPRSSLPKALYADPEVIEKARAMLRAGRSDAFVSDYLGMKAIQVAEIGEELRATARERPPAPNADDAVQDQAQAEARRRDAERGSAALLAAIRRYVARHQRSGAREQG